MLVYGAPRARSWKQIGSARVGIAVKAAATRRGNRLPIVDAKKGGREGQVIDGNEDLAGQRDIKLQEFIINALRKEESSV